MKVNLTKLLESPTRVFEVKKPQYDETGFFIKRENQSTSPEEPYSFELEKEKFILKEAEK
jgi:hypothetical protein